MVRLVSAYRLHASYHLSRMALENSYITNQLKLYACKIQQSTTMNHKSWISASTSLYLVLITELNHSTANNIGKEACIDTTLYLHIDGLKADNVDKGLCYCYS